MTNAAPFDYLKEANATLSNKFHGEKVQSSHLKNVLGELIKAGQRLDRIKKAIFYGRDLDPKVDTQPDQGANALGLPHRIDAENPERGEVILHSIIGKVTESIELAELLFAVLYQGTQFDEVNFIEEVGDGFWYDAIGLLAVNSNFGEAQRINIAKLRARFPAAFNEFDANNRDLLTERKVLENGAVDNRS